MANHDILTELAAYCEATKLSPATVCGRATGNARLHERLERRLAKLDEDVSALQAYMAKNPPMVQPREAAE